MKRLRSSDGKPLWVRALLLVGLTLLLADCRRPRGDARNIASAAPDASAPAIASATPLVEEPPWSGPELAWFPEREGELVRDAHADVTAFGGAGEPPLSEACALLSSDCDELTRLGLRRVLRLHYVGASDSRARAVALHLTFGSPENAFAHFTDRIGEAAEAGKPAFAALPLPGAAVMGEGTLLAWKANQLLELVMSHDRLSPEENAANAARQLPQLARSIGARLPGEATLPVAVQLLPSEGRKPLSIRYDAFDLAGLPGVGPGARASYVQGAETYAVGVLVRGDFDAAEDVLETLRKLPGSRKLKDAPYRATRVVELDEKSGRRVEWIFGQKGTFVAGVGVESRPSVLPRKEEPERLARLRRLKLMLDAMRH